MTEHEKIEHLKTTAPRVELTRRQRVERLFGQLLGLVAVVAVVLSLVAIQQSAGVGKCVNSNQGRAVQPNQITNAAEQRFANAFDAALHGRLSPGAARTEVTHYKNELARAQKLRDATPLGLC